MSVQSGSRASMLANMHNCITLKVGMKCSLKVDLCANGAGAYMQQCGEQNPLTFVTPARVLVLSLAQALVSVSLVSGAG